MVIALLAAANRDETVFPDPDRFDIGRTGNNRHMALGFGLHYCLGASLARLETKIAINTILRRFPDLALAVPRDAIRWRQSSGLRGLVSLPVVLGAEATSTRVDMIRRSLPADAMRDPDARGTCPMYGHRPSDLLSDSAKTAA